MLEGAVQFSQSNKQEEETSLEALLRCLRLAGVVENRGQKPEVTWFKLNEWLIVEIAEIFGSFMNYQPFWMFPFGEMIKVCLLKLLGTADYKYIF